MKDIRQSLKWAIYLQKIGWSVGKIDDAFVFYKKIPIIGRIAKIQRPQRVPTPKSLDSFSKKNKISILYIEPKTTPSEKGLQKWGFWKTNKFFLPTKTIYLDISKSKQKIFNQMKSDARYSLRKCQKGNINCEVEENLENFRRIWRESVSWKRYVPSLSHLVALKDSFRDDCIFLINRNYPSGAIFLVSDKTAYYWQAFTSASGRNNLAQYQIIWTGILWAKRKGAKILDFEGVYDKRFPIKSWLGFSHFKKSFGGKSKEFPHPFVKYYNRFLRYLSKIIFYRL